MIAWTRRLLGTCTACALLLAACDESLTDTDGQEATIQLNAQFVESLVEGAELIALVDRVRVLVQRQNDNVVLDQNVTWPEDTEMLELGPFSLPLETSPETFNVTLEAFADDDLLFGFGPVQITLQQGENEVVPAELGFQGAGAEAVRVSIESSLATPRIGDTFEVTAVFLDAEDEVVDGDYRLIHWISLDEEAAAVGSDGEVEVLDAPGRTAQITAEVLYLDIAVDTLSFPVLSQLSAEPDKMVVEFAGAVELSETWSGMAETNIFLGNPDHDHTLIAGAPGDHAWGQETQLMAILPGEPTVGNHEVGTWDPTREVPMHTEGGGIDFQNPFVHISMDRVSQEGGWTAKILVSTAGTIAISDFVPGDPVTGQGGRLVGDIMVTAESYLVEYSYDTQSATATDLEETVYFNAAFDLQQWDFVQGSMIGNVSGPVPVAVTGTANGNLGTDPPHTWAYGMHFDWDENFHLNASLDLPLDATDPVGSYDISADDEVYFFLDIYTDDKSYYPGDAALTSGTMEVKSVVQPTETQFGEVVVRVQATVPLFSWDSDAGEDVPEGVAGVDLVFHIPLYPVREQQSFSGVPAIQEQLIQALRKGGDVLEIREMNRELLDETRRMRSLNRLRP